MIDVTRVKLSQEKALDKIQNKLFEEVQAQISELERGHSPIDPDASMKAALAIAGGSMAAFVGVTSASSTIEAFSLGQMEVPGRFLAQLVALYGLSQMIGATVRVPYHWGVQKGHEYYWASKFQPTIPGAGYIINMFSRWALTPDLAHKLMRYHGYSAIYDSWWDELAKTPLRYFAMNAIARAGLYDYEFFESELKRSGYSREAIDYLHKSYHMCEMTTDVKEGMSTLRRLYKEGYVVKAEISKRFDEFRAIDDPMRRQGLVAEWEYEYDLKTDQRKLILDQFTRGNIDRGEATAQMSRIMPISERVAILLDRQELRIKVEQIPEPKERALSKAEILRAYRTQIKPEGWARSRLITMHYTQEDIEVLISLYAPKIEPEELPA